MFFGGAGAAPQRCGDGATRAHGASKVWVVYLVPMDDLAGDWTAIGTLVLAVVTALLAIATGWLAWKTSGMASATREMANATAELVKIEHARRAEEGLANLIIAHRERARTSEGTAGRMWGIPPFWILVQNTGRGEATNISVAYRQGDKGGVFYRERLEGLGSFSFAEYEFHPPVPGDLHVSDHSLMKIGWTDARGSHASPIYQWDRGRSGAPILASDSTDA